MAQTPDFLLALNERTAWVDALLLDPAMLDRVKPVHLRRLVAAYLERGGKRLRPAVLLFCCGAVGGDERLALPAAASLELFHTWTLMHDDIIDHDALRRGGPTGHVLAAGLGAADWGLGPVEAADYGTSLSMLAGDVQHGLCVWMFSRCEGVPPPLLLQLIADLELNIVADLVEGETRDVQLEQRPISDVTLDEVLRMMYLKTGVLYEFAGKAGAMLGLGTRDEQHPQVDALRSFCANCGTAFQLQDDILGVVGNEGKLGKPVGSDITEGKRTPVLLTAWERADAADRKRLGAAVGVAHASPEAVLAAIEVMTRLGAVDAVAALAREHTQLARQALRSLPESQYTAWLSGWADFMVEREF